MYYAHRDDPETSLADVAKALGGFVADGRVRELGASNFTADRLSAALDAAQAVGVRGYSVLQNEYNLVSRDAYEGAVQDLCVAHGVAALPFYGLASGFLSGKYRSPADWEGKARAAAVARNGTERGFAVLETMDAVSAQTGAPLPAIALAWLLAQPGIAAPIASATSLAQVHDLVAAVSLELSQDQVAALNAV